MTPHTTFNTLMEQTAGPAEFAAAFMDDLGLTGIFERMDIAEEEIATARKRRPEASDQLYHSFHLLTPTHERMEYEPVYRSHCRELLHRVAAGTDTRPGTAAEVCCALHEVSLITPITSPASGLYFRMWRSARLPDFPELTDLSKHHEALEGSRIDDHESVMRRKLADPTRTLDGVECRGLHHGERVTCTLAPAPALLDSLGAGVAS
ncbi:hypothetical protein [Glycomyces sp. NPDC021274]|uniref:hypothetical protein n=1 Tax=Glycomyces sp. NPDC021274 TaxID=3155120 RepID=UPI0033F145FE